MVVVSSTFSASLQPASKNTGNVIAQRIAHERKLLENFMGDLCQVGLRADEFRDDEAVRVGDTLWEYIDAEFAGAVRW